MWRLLIPLKMLAASPEPVNHRPGWKAGTDRHTHGGSHGVIAPVQKRRAAGSRAAACFLRGQGPGAAAAAAGARVVRTAGSGLAAGAGTGGPESAAHCFS